jgi:2-methylcitrate dehydratase PrpD
MGSYSVTFNGSKAAASALDAAGMQKSGETGPPAGTDRYVYVVDAISEEAAQRKVFAALGDVEISDLKIQGDQ